ncbi:hypothetical protein QLQ12_42900 [Actinoplanes sp. NEAU-A12]|uniref:Nitrile hydratase alpha /Thiocyanate hydrolase gamma domain-containing protein n=1 Tax=Actinoplanes sandaracinus TaxID=3045177 RepID=A0ABT6X0H2_9ACTN|nr:hypothetical protein [Actinoplanes sandaracinus]MDI6105351.1 hypothetical protein [Actinoplanes sandaracinus]
MDPTERALFITAYGRLVADVWSDPDQERLLADDPHRLLAEHDLGVPPEVPVVVVRDAQGADPDIGVQVQAWLDAGAGRTFVLYVPALDPVSEQELSEHELDSVVAGIDPAGACCCPCCCT